MGIPVVVSAGALVAAAVVAGAGAGVGVGVGVGVAARTIQGTSRIPITDGTITPPIIIKLEEALGQKPLNMIEDRTTTIERNRISIAITEMDAWKSPNPMMS